MSIIKKILLVSALLFFGLTNAYAATQVEYTVMPSGGDFTNLQAAITYVAANHPDLTNSDEYVDIKIDGTWTSPDTNAVTITGITTDADNYLKIYTTTSARHGGQIDSGYYLDTGYGTTTISIAQSGTYHIDGIAIKMRCPNNSNYARAVNIENYINTTLYFSNNILYGSTTDATASISRKLGLAKGYGGNHTWYVWNNFFTNLDASGITSYVVSFKTFGSGTVYFYNNTIRGSTGSYGIYTDVGTVIAKNNIITGSDSGDYSIIATSPLSTHNISGDATVPPEGTYYASTTITFVSASDSHLDAGETDAIGQGINLIYDDYIAFNDDIDEDTRGGTWDIGADQVTATADIPVITDFEVPETHRGNLIVPITTFTAQSQGTIDGYLITESSTTPSASDPNWSGTVPATYTASTSGELTLYAWVKNDDDTISNYFSDDVEILLYASTMEVWANSGEDLVRRDEILLQDGRDVTNYQWDGTKIIMKEAKNGFASFSLYIEAGGDATGGIDLTDISVEMSNLDGATPITTETRQVDDLFNFTNRNIELFYTRYLQVQGMPAAKGGENPAEDQYSVDMRRPNSEVWTTSDIYPQDNPAGYWKTTADDNTNWYDRPGANKYFPEILVPLELHETFDITAGESQQIWCDIYIPKTTTAGIYTGTVTIKDGGVTVKTVPVELEVYDFTLPDVHNMKTWASFESAIIPTRWRGSWQYTWSALTQAEKDELTDTWIAMNHLLQRHGGVAYRVGHDVEQPLATFSDGYKDFEKQLDGSLFTDTYNYAGPGYNTPPGVFMIGLYASPWWRGFVDAVPVTFTGTGLNDFGRKLGGWAYAHNGIMEYSSDGRTYVVEIDSEGTPDTFRWSMDGGVTWEATLVPISATGGINGSGIPLTGSNIGGRAPAFGVSIDWDDPSPQFDRDWTIAFTYDTGHTLGDSWTFTPYSEAEIETAICTALDSLYTYLIALDDDMRVLWGMYDEPKYVFQYTDIENWTTIKDACTGGGENVLSYVDHYMPHVYQYSPSADVAIVASRVLDAWDRSHLGGDVVLGWDYYEDIWRATPGKELASYNIGLGDNTLGMLYSGWDYYYRDLVWNFIYSIALWTNNEGGYFTYYEHTNVFQQSCTLRCGHSNVTFASSLSSDGEGVGLNDFERISNYTYVDDHSADIDYVLEVDSEGTPDTFKWSNDGGTTWEATLVPMGDGVPVALGLGTTDWSPQWDANTGHTLGDRWEWTFKGIDLTYGRPHTGGNGKGVWLYPGTDSFYPDDSYGVDGVFAGIKMKMYRKTVQDNDYLHMAAAINENAVNNIAYNVGMRATATNPAEWGNVGTDYGGLRTFAYQLPLEIGSVEDFAFARGNLADIILGQYQTRAIRNAIIRNATFH